MGSTVAVVWWQTTHTVVASERFAWVAGSTLSVSLPWQPKHVPCAIVAGRGGAPNVVWHAAHSSLGDFWWESSCSEIAGGSATGLWQFVHSAAAIGR